MTMVDIRLNRNFVTFGATRVLFFTPVYSHKVQSRYRMFPPFVKFQSQRFLQAAFYSLKVERIFVLIGRIVTLS